MPEVAKADMIGRVLAITLPLCPLMAVVAVFIMRP